MVNFSPEAHEGYRFGVPGKLYYEEVFNTDDVRLGRLRCVQYRAHPCGKHPIPWAGHLHFPAVPPLGAVFLQGGSGRNNKE